MTTEPKSNLTDLRTQLMALTVPCHCNACTGSRGNYCQGTGTQPGFPGVRANVHEVGPTCLPGCPGYSGWNPDPDAIYEALDKAGLSYQIKSNPDHPGIFVGIWVGHQKHALAIVEPSEGLRGQAALITAMLRASGEKP